MTGRMPGWRGLCIAVTIILAMQGLSRAATPGDAGHGADAREHAAQAMIELTQANERAAVAYTRAFYRPTTTLQERLDALMPDYVEHGALFARFNEINHVQGREAFRLVFQTLSRLRGGGAPIGPRAGGAGSSRPAGNVLYQVIAQGDRVIVLNQQFQPDPQHPGKYYEAFVFDGFRMDHGKIAEHWDDTTLPAKLPMYLRVPVSQLHFPKPQRPIYGAGDASAAASPSAAGP